MGIRVGYIKVVTSLQLDGMPGGDKLDPCGDLGGGPI